MVATPIPNGTDISETIDDKEHSRVIVRDAAGNDAFGLAVANPAQYSLLGRLKALVDTVLSLVGLTSPANNFFPITPGANPLSTIPNTIYVAGEGTLVVQGADGVQASFNVAAKSYHPIRPRYVLGASTATGIVGLS